MPSRSTLFARRLGRGVGLTGALLGLTAGVSLVALPAAADSATSVRAGKFTISGAGFGHGMGMSQYGAYGAAVQGRSWRQILAFYYPGTTLADAPRSTIRVWISGDTDGDARVAASAGLKVSDAAGKSYRLPTGSAYRYWRISRSGSGYKLTHRSTSGGWKTRSTPLGTSTWSFSNSAGLLRLYLPRGTRDVRGTVSLVKRGSSGRTVNRLSLDNYVRGVVPAEMPTSWHPNAVRVQAVAARTYAAKLQTTASVSAGYDLCDTTNCQVYRGKGAETAAGNAAVSATAKKILMDGTRIALAMFSSANGGQSISGGVSYLRAAPDPYDGVIKSQSWTRTVTASSIGRRWSVGTVRQLRINQRTGQGRWGGWVTSISIIGSRRTVTVSGNTFKYAFGLRSTYFTINGGGGSPAVPPVVIKPGKPYASFPRSYHSASAVDLLLVNSAGNLLRYPVAKGRVGSAATIGSGFGGYSHVINAGDWNGDGYQDVIARTSRSRLLLFRGTSSGRFAAGVDMGLVSNHTLLTSVGDLNRDRYPDLVVVSRTGYAYVAYGNGRLGFRSTKLFAQGWQQRTAVRGVGDFDRDGRVDLVASTGGRLWLHRGTATGFAAGRDLGVSLSGIAAVGAVGDVSGDGKVDVLGRTSKGQLRLFRGNGSSKLGAPTALPGNYARTRFVI